MCMDMCTIEFVSAYLFALKFVRLLQLKLDPMHYTHKSNACLSQYNN